ANVPRSEWVSRKGTFQGAAIGRVRFLRDVGEDFPHLPYKATCDRPAVCDIGIVPGHFRYSEHFVPESANRGLFPKVPTALVSMVLILWEPVRRTRCVPQTPEVRLDTIQATVAALSLPHPQSESACVLLY